MIGFTVAMGNTQPVGMRASCPYSKYAELSGNSAIKHLGLEKIIILSEEHLAKIDTSHIESFAEKCFYLKMFVFRLFPEVDRYLYFDVDWTCYNTPNPRIKSKILDSEKLVVVRDRPHFVFISNAAEKIKVDKFRYFNAGFYVANREHHYSFFEKCINLYNDVPKEFADQCMMNYVAYNYNYPILYANRMWNMQDRHTWWFGENRSFESSLKCIGYHEPYNYDYHEGLVNIDGGNIEVDQEGMELISGWYLFEGPEFSTRIFLLSDGYSDNGSFSWILDANHLYIFQPETGELIVPFDRVNYSFVDGFFKAERFRLIRLN